METCAICLDDITNNDYYQMEKCGHIFHKKCILKWFSKSNTCPCCRSNVDNIFYIKTKNNFVKKKTIMEITNQMVNFYDEQFDKKTYFFLLQDLKDLKIYNNKLELSFLKENTVKRKNIYFVNQTYCLMFYKYMSELFYYNFRY